MVKIDASEYETNWLTDSPKKEGQPNDGEEVVESDSTPTETEQAAKALESVLNESVSKNWIPYEGPEGGEGWQNANDPDDVRYGLDEPPGEIEPGYEEMAEEWGDTSEGEWFTESLEQGELSSVDSIDEGEWVTIDGEIRQIESIKDNGFIFGNAASLFEVKDGIIVDEQEFDNPIQGAIQYLEFSEDSETESGWFQVGEDWDIVESPSGGNQYAATVTDSEGNTESVGMSEIEGRRRAVEVEPVNIQSGKPWEKYDNEIPESDSLPESLSIGDMDRLDEVQVDHIQSGLTKADTIGLLEHADSIKQYDEDSRMLQFKDVIASYSPGDKTLRINPDEFSEERIERGHESGRFVAENRSELMIHEAMHVAHAQNLGSIDEAEEMINTDLNSGEMAVVADSVSRYAAQNPMELVAEVGLKILKGEEVSNGALWAYEKFQGPQL